MCQSATRTHAAGAEQTSLNVLQQLQSDHAAQGAMQVLATLSFHDKAANAPQAWMLLVQSASAINMVKWSMVRIGTTGIVLALVAVSVLEVRDGLSKGGENGA